MIGRIRGQIVEIGDRYVLIEVGGVAYEVEVTSSALVALPQVPGTATLYTHFVVREDAQLLYGFASKAERDVFRALIRINGVGPKLALSLISSITLEQLSESVRNNDASLLTRVPGVGKKTAERLLVELKDRLGKFAISSTTVSGSSPNVVVREAEDALVALGYKPAEAQRAVASVAGESQTTEGLLRAALKRIARQVEVTG